MSDTLKHLNATPVRSMDDRRLCDAMEHAARIIGEYGLREIAGRARTAALIREAIRRIKQRGGDAPSNASDHRSTTQP